MTNTRGTHSLPNINPSFYLCLYPIFNSPYHIEIREEKESKQTRGNHCDYSNNAGDLLLLLATAVTTATTTTTTNS